MSKQVSWQRGASKEHSLHFMLTLFFHLKLVLKTNHWMTKSYARHVAIDRVTESLDKKIDRLIEVHIGRFGRGNVSVTVPTIKFDSYVDNLPKFVSDIHTAVKGLALRFEELKERELTSITEEILEDLSTAKYLFELN